VQSYAPTATQRPHFLGVGQDLSLLRDYIPFILHDRMAFCAIVGMSSLGANIAATGNRERLPEVLNYYQEAVNLLRQRLADDSQRSGDAVIITLSCLCAVEVSFSSLRYMSSLRCVVLTQNLPNQQGHVGELCGS
jgi:hypothetical protein